MYERKTVVAAAIGECVHVAGVVNFLRLAEKAGWRTVFLGPAIPISQLLETAQAENADLIGVSYRLTPETGERLLKELIINAAPLKEQGMRFAFGGTPPVAKIAGSLGDFFDVIFDGSEPIEDVIAYLHGRTNLVGLENYPQTLAERWNWKSPYPLLRHHFGLPDLQATINGVASIAEARVLDIISLGIDQDGQENFFHPERQDPSRKGAGGVPVRNADDYRALYRASRTGNYPLMRTYSGTNDLIHLAAMYVETINIAWAAVPLFWFNDMDGRGPHDLLTSISEHQKLIAWYAARNIPVELNEPHHWGMREAPDVISVVASYLSAYNAKIFGVKDYIAQLMFNSPPGLTDQMDLAKMLASLEIISPLESSNFRIWRQTRIGLLSHPVDEEAARGHLGASTYLQMALHPHIVHIVGHSEAHHAATAQDVVAACRIARRAIENAIRGLPEMTSDPQVQERKNELLSEAAITLSALKELAGDGISDPFVDPQTLAMAVNSGLLDAPHLKANRYARGEIISAIDDRGACIAVDGQGGKYLSERERIAQWQKTLATQKLYAGFNTLEALKN